jgi:hypothetical protein
MTADTAIGKPLAPAGRSDHRPHPPRTMHRFHSLCIGCTLCGATEKWVNPGFGRGWSQFSVVALTTMVGTLSRPDRTDAMARSKSCIRNLRP